MNRRLAILIWVMLSASLTLMSHAVPAATAKSQMADAQELALRETSAPAPQPVDDNTPPSLTKQLKAALGRLLARVNIDAEAVKLYAKWIVGAPALVVLILIVMLLRPRLRRIDSKDNALAKASGKK